MKTMTWNRDSQGLFDYETRQCTKQKLTTDKSSMCVRVNQDCAVQDLGYDIDKEHGKTGQLLFNVKKVRNHYMVEPAEIEKLKGMTAAQRKEFMAKDVEMAYAETGEQLGDPIDTFEKIYLVVRNISNRNVKQQYTLKKFDIIKLGRVKFKVKKIHIKEVEDERLIKREQLKRRESEWRRKEIERLKKQQAMMKKKRMNSANLQAIQEQLIAEEAKAVDIEKVEESKKGVH